jgi:hypothetical protein
MRKLLALILTLALVSAACSTGGTPDDTGGGIPDNGTPLSAGAPPPFEEFPGDKAYFYKPSNDFIQYDEFILYITNAPMRDSIVGGSVKEYGVIFLDGGYQYKDNVRNFIFENSDYANQYAGTSEYLIAVGNVVYNKYYGTFSDSVMMTKEYLIDELNGILDEVGGAIYISGP